MRKALKKIHTAIVYVLQLIVGRCRSVRNIKHFPASKRAGGACKRVTTRDWGTRPYGINFLALFGCDRIAIVSFITQELLS